MTSKEQLISFERSALSLKGGPRSKENGQDGSQDIVISGVIGVTLLALFPAKQASPAVRPEWIVRQAEAGTTSS